VPSVLRGFSAPVWVTMSPPLSTAELLFALAHDADPFNRWEAAQMLARGRDLHSSTFQLNLNRFGHTSHVPLSYRLRGTHAPNTTHKLCLR